MFFICLDLSPAQHYLKRRVPDWCRMSADSRAASSPLGELRKLGSSTCISSILVCLSHTFFHWNSHWKSWHPNFPVQIFVFKTKYWRNVGITISMCFSYFVCSQSELKLVFLCAAEYLWYWTIDLSFERHATAQLGETQHINQNRVSIRRIEIVLAHRYHFDILYIMMLNVMVMVIVRCHKPWHLRQKLSQNGL